MDVNSLKENILDGFLGALSLALMVWAFSWCYVGVRSTFNWLDPSVNGMRLSQSEPYKKEAYQSCFYENGATVQRWPRIHNCPDFAPTIEGFFDRTINRFLVGHCSLTVPDLLNYWCLNKSVYRKVDWTDIQGDVHQADMPAPAAINPSTDFFVLNKRRHRGRSMYCLPAGKVKYNCFPIKRRGKDGNQLLDSAPTLKDSDQLLKKYK